VKLNLGSGEDYKDGDWINLDIRESANPDIVHDIEEGLPFEGDSIELVKARDILEHISRDKIRFVLSEIKRVLEEGGKLKIRVPDMKSYFLTDFSDDTLIERAWWIFGEDKNHPHRLAFTRRSLVNLLTNSGYKVKKIKKDEHPNIIIIAE